MLARRIRPAAICDRSSLVVERAARRSRSFLAQVARRVHAARLPGVVVSNATIRTGGLWAPGSPFVVVRSERCRDVRLYVGVRPAGQHLEVVLLTAIEPWWLKRMAAGALARGAWWRWSLPEALAGQEELRTMLTVVEEVVRVVARRIALRSAHPDGLLPPERRSVLEEWS